MTTPPQFSPDGQWWWDGERWVPAAQAPAPVQPEPVQPEPVQPEPPQAPQAPWATPQQPAASQQPPWSTTPQPAASAHTPWGTPQQPAPAYLPYGTPTPPQGTDGKAIGSLVAGLIWACGVGSVVAVILGHLSRSGARREGREPSGLALAGLILGYLGIAVMIGATVVLVAFKDPLVQGVKNDLELQSASDAQQSFHDATGNYATSLEELRNYGYDDLDGKVDVRVLRADATGYCLSARSFGMTYYVSDAEPETSETPCR